MALGADLLDDLVAAGEAGLAHGLGVKRDIGPGRSVAGGRKVVRVDLAVDLEDLEDELRREFRPGQEPLPRRPRLQDGFGQGIRQGQLDDGLEMAVDEDDLFQGFCGRGGDRLIGQGFDQGFDVVAAEHRPQHADGVFPRNSRRFDIALGYGGQPAGLDLGRGVDARRDAVLEEASEAGSLARLGLLEAQADIFDLRRRQGERRQAGLGPFFLLLEIRIQHGSSPGMRFWRRSGAS